MCVEGWHRPDIVKLNQSVPEARYFFIAFVTGARTKMELGSAEKRKQDGGNIDQKARPENPFIAGS